MTIDYDIHGWLGLRLGDHQAGSARYVARQLNPLVPTTLATEPDVSLTEVSDDVAAKMAYRLGNAGDYQECAFGDSDFCIRNGGKTLCIPFESIGTCCEISYTRGFSLGAAFNYVRSILQLSLLTKGALAMHSAAMLYNGKGILFAGWAESGKTEAMLGFLNGGATFVSDKWTIVKEDGSAIYNFPSPITVRKWVLEHLPELAKNLTPLERWRLGIGALANALADRAARSNRIELAGEAAHFFRPALAVGGRVTVTPSRLFRKGDNVSWSLSHTAPLDKVFFLMTTSGGRISVRPADSTRVVQRLVDCAQYERRRLTGLYTKFRYAFPDRRSAIIEEARERETGMLMKALESKEVFLVEVPFPFDPMVVCEALDPFCK